MVRVLAFGVVGAILIMAAGIIFLAWRYSRPETKTLARLRAGAIHELSGDAPYFHVLAELISRDSRKAGNIGLLAEADVNGDGKLDRLRVDGDARIWLSRSLRSPVVFGSAIVAGGAADANGDSFRDFWWADPGDTYLAIVFGGTPHVAMELISLRGFNVSGMSLFDIDDDGVMDAVYTSGNETDSKIRWFPLLPSNPIVNSSAAAE